MARTKKDKPRTPRKKQNFKRKMENIAGGSILRKRRRGRKLLNVLSTQLQQQQQQSPSTSTTMSSPCFFIDTNPSTTQISNNENSNEIVNETVMMTGAQKRRLLRRKAKVVNTLNNTPKTSVTAENSMEVTSPLRLAGEIMSKKFENSVCITSPRRRDSKRNQSTAEKVRQKWRKYTKERLKKSNLSTKAGVSPNAKAAKTKATILVLLGDKSIDMNEFNSTIESDANLLQDLDLVILAAAPVDYEVYTKLLRQEYASMNDESYKQMRLKKREKHLQRTLNQSADFNFNKFRAEIAKNKKILNSTECVSPHIAKNHTSTKPNASRTIEEGEIISDLEETLRKTSKIAVDDGDDDCIVVERTIEQIVIDDDTTPNIDEEDNQKEPVFFEDTTGTPTLKFTPHEQTEKSTSSSKRRSCTAVLNSSDVIILDETYGSSPNSLMPHNSMDDSVMFVAESAPDFIPLVSDNVPKPLQVIRNPFSPKLKKSQQQSSNDTLFTKSEKKALENYNVNTYNPQAAENKAALKQNKKRMVIIDSSNVAYGHSLQREFSVKGLVICIEYFKKMGHEVKAVVPQMRLKYKKSTDPETLDKLYKEGIVVFTPCKSLPGNPSSSYDDRFILQLACEMDAAIVSNDNYRDLINENAAFKKLIMNRVIGYTWVNDIFMLPKDPYGKHGPSLNEILNRNPKKP